MHLSADPRYAESAFRIGAIGGADLGYSGIWKPVLTSVTTVDREQLGPLAQRWRERLRPLPDPRLGDQLGFTRIYSRIAEGPDSGSPCQCLYDPEEPDCWIVETSTRIYATSGARLRHAVGHLQAIEIGLWQGEYQVHYNVFAADQNGTPWIMPEPSGEAYSLGYDGSSPRALSIAISELCSDINAMLSGNDQFNFIGDQEEPCGLRDKLIALKSPLTLHRCDIDRLLAPATLG